MRYCWVPVLCLALAPSTAALAQSDPDLAEAVRARLASVAPAIACINHTIACGQTLAGTLGSGGCLLPNGNPVDYYQFSGTKNEQISASLSTSVFNPFLELIDPNQNLVNSAMSNAPGTVTVTSALNNDGTWTIAATSSGSPTTGAYMIGLQCGSGTPTCIPNDTTLCVGNSRFQVRASFTANGNTGNAHAVALTGDTGYLWFFSASNVETVIKVLNGCSLNGRYWVFAGGLTDVKVDITVIDLKTGATKIYHNLAGSPFQPIQDTSAFPTCP